jgi:NAD(P)-dependent dehydrogenase (short-subunit alcohol dehydrogenase family)
MSQESTEAFQKFDLTGRTAVVTGGSAGLGYFMARGLARSGARVVLAARRESALKEAADKMAAEAPQGQIEYAAVDLNDRGSIDDFARTTLERFAGIDILIGNAGADLFEPVDQISYDNFDQVMQINIAANIALMRAYLPHMREQKWGRVMFSSSSTSLASSAQEGMSVYTAAKGGLNAFARTAAAELGHDNITVNTIVFGMYLTDMVKAHLEVVAAAAGIEAVRGFEVSFASMTAAGRLGDCEEVEGLAQLLASNAGSYITGSNLVIDGGMSVMLRPNEPRPERLVYS